VGAASVLMNGVVWVYRAPMSLQRASQRNSAAFVRALGTVIRARRLRLKKTCAQIAIRSGLSEAAIVRAESFAPDLDLLGLVAIAAALDLPLRTLLRRAERKIQGARKTRRTARR
jgi:hypothetical protein